MVEPVALSVGGRRTMLKWHRARRQPSDMEFHPGRIAQGLAAGASLEVDLVRHAGGGFAVLHDETLERSTTGTGRVAEADALTLRNLFRRDIDGAQTTERVMLLGDLCDILAARDIHNGAVVHLDLKEGAQALTEADVAAFAAAARQTRSLLLSGGDAQAVAKLSAHVPGLRTGFDPCHVGAIKTLPLTRDFDGFVEATLAAAPNAEMIYLDHQLLLWAHDGGVDLVAPFHAAGKRVDAYTLTRAGPQVADIVPRLLALKVDEITTNDAVGLAAQFG